MNEIAETNNENNKEVRHPHDLVLDLSGEKYRELREQQIEEELEEEFNHKAEDVDEQEDIQIKREEEYSRAMAELGDLPLTEESRTELRKKMVDDVIGQAEDENEHFGELIREKKIIEYLDRELEGEERLAKPIDPDCEVSMVVPVYAERDYIFRPLKSLVEQEGVEPSQYEAIFVVNNKGEEPRRDIDETDADYERKLELHYKAVGADGENQEVINIIRHINGEKVDVSLSAEEKRVVRGIKKKGLNIHVIDKASEGKTLARGEDNVGGARNRGVAEAVARFYEQKHENGIITQSDSDTRLDKNYFRDVIDAFKSNPEMVGAGGGLEFEQADNSELFRRVANHEEMNYRYRRLMHFAMRSARPGNDKDKDIGKIAFSGANMMSRAYESAIVGGVPKQAGGEDPEFGYRLAELGNTRHIDEIKTYPADRESARTAVNAGHGQNKIKTMEAFREKRTVEVDSLDYFQAREDIRSRLMALFAKGEAGFDNLKNLFTVKGKQLLVDDDINYIEKNFIPMQDADKAEVIDERIRISAQYENNLRRIFPKKPVDEAARDLVKELANRPEIGPKYRAIYEQMEEKENAYVRGRQEKMDLITELVYKEGKNKFDDDTMYAFLSKHRNALGLDKDSLENIRNEKYIIARLIDSLNQAETQVEAKKNIENNFKEELSFVEDDSLKQGMLELRAMHQAKRELDNN